jgi:hypothetical protein
MELGLALPLCHRRILIVRLSIVPDVTSLGVPIDASIWVARVTRLNLSNRHSSVVSVT